MVWSGPQLQEWAAEPAAYLTDQRPGRAQNEVIGNATTASHGAVSFSSAGGTRSIKPS